jgi:NTE family protein
MKESINVVLSGSGTLFYYHIGAIKRILESYSIKSVVGTSGGSIVGALVAIGYSIEQIEQMAKTINLKDCADYSFNPFDRLGLIDGKKIKESLKRYMNLRFKDIPILLSITVTNYDTKSKEYFNQLTTPDLFIYEAVRASMSIPFVFKYTEINKTKYIDGGICDNFPIDYFKDKTLGVKIESNPKKDNSNRSKVSNWLLGTFGITYIMDIIGMMMSSVEKKHIEDAIYSKIINIKSDKNGLDFNHTLNDINDMIFQGYKITDEYLKTNVWN